MEMRNKTQADLDIERIFEMLDTALTSQDERVQSALRALLTIIALTKPQEDGRMAIETSHGPLRQMQEDLKNLNRSLNNLREEVRQMTQRGGGGNNPWAPPGGLPIPGNPYTNPGSPYDTGSTYTWTGVDPKSSRNYPFNTQQVEKEDK